MAYNIVLHTQAADDLKSMERSSVRRIVRKLQWLQEQDNPLLFSKKLLHPAVGDIRFRIGDYRAIGIVREKEKTIVIIKVGHRKDIYR